jgi:pimeloyl-ACP methyl ester carboxylesterase
MIVTVDGRAAYAYTGGRPHEAAAPDAPAIAFVHGALNDHSVWGLLARWYAHHGHRVLAVDLAGHGRSAGPALPSVEAAADWLLAVLDAAGVERAHLVGHSMGSLIALEAASRAPARAASLAMVGTAYPMKVSPALLETAREQPRVAIDRVNAFSHSTLAAKPSFPGPGVWLHGASRALMRRIQDGYVEGNLFEHDFRVCDAYAGGLEAAAKVTCPVRLILGDRDQMTPPKATAAIAAALRAQVAHVPAGHALMQEAPDAVLRALQGLVPAVA